MLTKVVTDNDDRQAKKLRDNVNAKAEKAIDFITAFIPRSVTNAFPTIMQRKTLTVIPDRDLGEFTEIGEILKF
uniref:Uncharacterized protein n=1 Tax=Panagrolaimus sp. PS1159 TaxID=55785 RepID=A0AC35G3V9_9BILA